MEPSLETQLRQLLDKSEIRDVLMRYGRGVDRGDPELILAAFHPDATIDAGKGVMTPGDIASRTGDDHVQTHFYSNALIELLGNRALVETYFLAFHAEERGGKPFLRTRAARTIDEFERRDGVWRIAKRVVADDWSMVNQVLERAAGVPVTGRRSREDPLYRLQGRVSP